jgi:probable rRNA maturation factor
MRRRPIKVAPSALPRSLQRRAAARPLELAVQYATSRRGLPHRRSVERWLRAAVPQAAAITVRFAGEKEVSALNGAFRGRQKPTNVLAFPYTDERPRKHTGSPIDSARSPRNDAGPPLNGDIVLCAQVVRREARAQGKNPRAHFAHLVVHGALHLQGYDHRTRAQARLMESRERAILAGLGYPDPYQE